MNVPDFLHPRKEPGISLYIGLILVLVTVTSFGLGRLSAIREEKAGLTVLYPEGMQEEVFLGNSASAVTAVSGGGGSVTALSGEQIVASKSGTKYHYLWCSGAKSIKEENKIYFKTVDEARLAGYEPASNCKGLQ